MPIKKQPTVLRVGLDVYLGSLFTPILKKSIGSGESSCPSNVVHLSVSGLTPVFQCFLSGALSVNMCYSSCEVEGSQ